MYRYSHHCLLLAALTPVIACAQAQAVSSSSATETQLHYRSVFEQYRHYSEQPVASWREVNDTVGLVGGWRAYAKEANSLDTAETPKATADEQRSVTPAATAKPDYPAGRGAKP